MDKLIQCVHRPLFVEDATFVATITDSGDNGITVSVEGREILIPFANIISIQDNTEL